MKWKWAAGIASAFLVAMAGIMIGLSFAPSPPKQAAAPKAETQKKTEKPVDPQTEKPSAQQPTQQNAQQSMQQPHQNISPYSQPPSYPDPPTSSTTLGASDFALGGFALGDPKRKADAMYGSPYEKKWRGSTLYCKYSGIEIHYLNGRAITILSDDTPSRTPRGIAEGSRLSDVIAAYGQGYTMEQYDGLNLYEYRGTAPNGYPSILRFAVRPSDNRVYYIGLRVAE